MHLNGVSPNNSSSTNVSSPKEIVATSSYMIAILLCSWMHIHSLMLAYSSHKVASFYLKEQLYKTIPINVRVFPKFLLP